MTIKDLTFEETAEALRVESDAYAELYREHNTLIVQFAKQEKFIDELIEAGKQLWLTSVGSGFPAMSATFKWWTLVDNYRVNKKEAKQ